MDVSLISQHFPGLTPEQLDKFCKLENLYKDWNSKINVISRKDIDNFYMRHVLHSLSIAKFINFKPGSVVVDAGTGGGFPGLPLAIMFPAVNFVLIDSTSKKLKVIDEVSKSLGILNIKTKHARLEEINVACDFIVSRAVSRLDDMWNMTNSYLQKDNKNDLPNGLIYLKGGDISGEIPNNTFVQKIDLNELFGSAIFDEKSLVFITTKQR